MLKLKVINQKNEIIAKFSAQTYEQIEIYSSFWKKDFNVNLTRVSKNSYILILL